MAAAPRANPADFFSPAEWLTLSARSRWRGLWLVVHCWGVIALAMAMGVQWPLTIPLAVLIIGNRQLGLFILMHDAAHGLLHPNRRVNDVVCRWLCSSSLGEYRPYHLQHHRFVQQAEDPDLVLSAPFPITRASLRRKVWRDLSGQTFYKQRIGPFFAAQLCERAGIRAVTQLHNHTLIASPGMAYHLFAGLPPEWLGLELDPGNQSFDGHEEWNRSARLLGSSLVALGVKDTGVIRDMGRSDGPDKGWARYWTPIDNGVTDWHQVVRALQAIDFAGTFVFMPFYAPEEPAEMRRRLREEVAYLRDIVAEVAP